MPKPATKATSDEQTDAILARIAVKAAEQRKLADEWFASLNHSNAKHTKPGSPSNDGGAPASSATTSPQEGLALEARSERLGLGATPVKGWKDGETGKLSLTTSAELEALRRQVLGKRKKGERYEAAVNGGRGRTEVVSGKRNVRSDFVKGTGSSSEDEGGRVSMVGKKAKAIGLQVKAGTVRDQPANAFVSGEDASIRTLQESDGSRGEAARHSDVYRAEGSIERTTGLGHKSCVRYQVSNRVIEGWFSRVRKHSSPYPCQIYEMPLSESKRGQELVEPPSALQKSNEYNPVARGMQDELQPAVLPAEKALPKSDKVVLAGLASLEQQNEDDEETKKQKERQRKNKSKKARMKARKLERSNENES